MKPVCHLVLGAVLAAAMAGAAPAGRYEAFTARAAKGKLMKVVSAGHFGTGADEEFVAAGSLPDGTIVAFGNAWGPTFPEPVQPVVVGKGEWYEVNEYPDGYPTTEEGRRLDPSPDFPNIAGMIVQYAPDMKSYRRVVRFDWGLATVTCGAVAADGDLIVAGRGTDHLRAFAEAAEVANTVPPGDDRRGFGPIYYQGVKMPGDVYALKMAPDGSKVRWVWIFEGHRTPPTRMWSDLKGGVTFELQGEIHRLSLDGKDLRRYGTVHTGGRFRLLAVSPFDGSYVTGGDRHFGTGREPWRKPECYAFDRDGNLAWKIWDWTGPLVGQDRFRLVSDSSVRLVSYDAETSDLFVYGWSDGGNTVFTRQPTDLEKSIPWVGFRMELWGAGVGSFAHLVRVDTKTLQAKAYAAWCAYLPDDYQDPKFANKPNSATLDCLQAGPDGTLGFIGRAATGLIQTPNSFYKYPGGGARYGGYYAAVFDKDFSNLYFSSYMPGCTMAGVGRTRRGFALVGRSVGSDAERGDGRVTPSPSAEALQPAWAGGRWDAHITVIELP